MYSVYSHPARRLLRRVLFWMSGGLIWYALMLWIFTPDVQRQKILWIVDNSLSMNVRDVSTADGGFISRLEASLSVIRSFSGVIPWEHALLTFARTPLLQMPFSADEIYRKNVLDGIVPIVYWWGSDMAKALSFVHDMYGNNPWFQIVMLTDAEFIDMSAIQALHFAPKRMMIVGVGTSEGGYMIQWYDAEGLPIYKEHQGKRVLSRLDQPALESIATLLSADTAYIDHEDAVALLQKQLITPYQDMSQQKWSWYMLLGVVIFLVSRILGEYTLVSCVQKNPSSSL